MFIILMYTPEQDNMLISYLNWMTFDIFTLLQQFPYSSVAEIQSQQLALFYL